MGKSQRITHFACPQHVKMGSTTDNSEPEGLFPLFLRCLEPERCLNLNLESKPIECIWMLCWPCHHSNHSSFYVLVTRTPKEVNEGPMSHPTLPSYTFFQGAAETGEGEEHQSHPGRCRVMPKSPQKESIRRHHSSIGTGQRFPALPAFAHGLMSFGMDQGSKVIRGFGIWLNFLKSWCLQDLTRFRIDDSYWLDLLGLFSLEPAFSWIASEQQKVTFTAHWTKACTNFPEIFHGLPGKVT